MKILNLIKMKNNNNKKTRSTFKKLLIKFFHMNVFYLKHNDLHNIINLININICNSDNEIR